MVVINKKGLFLSVLLAVGFLFGSVDIVSSSVSETIINARIPLNVYADGSGIYPTIQAAIDAAGDGDEVIVHDGTYRELLIFDGSKNIIVRSANGADKTIINGDVDNDGTGNGRVVSFTGGDS